MQFCTCCEFALCVYSQHHKTLYKIKHDHKVYATSLVLSVGLCMYTPCGHRGRYVSTWHAALTMLCTTCDRQCTD